MRVLIDRITGSPAEGDVDDDRLRALYDAPGPWLRASMVSTVDGGAAGDDGTSGSINNAADHRVFRTVRAWADAIIVGAGTARTEGYREAQVPLVVVSRRGSVPEPLCDLPAGKVLLATCAAAPGLDASRGMLGSEAVLVAGDSDVELRGLRDELVARGLTRLLNEGGPHLLGTLLAADIVDELCLTVVPGLVTGAHPRITAGADAPRPLRLGLLLEDEGTLLGRWLVGDRSR